MSTYLITIGLILVIMLFGIVVQQFYKLFARRHPELGPFRDDSKGCGSCSAGSGCSGSASCDSRH
jgi:hypothetical protein